MAKKSSKKASAGKKRARAAAPPPPPPEVPFDFRVPKSVTDAAEAAYWREIKRRQPTPDRFSADSLKPYPLPEKLEIKQVLRRPLTPTQKAALRFYQQWNRQQPQEPLTPEERKARELKMRREKYAQDLASWQQKKPMFPGFNPDEYKDVYVAPERKKKSPNPKNKR